MAVLSVIILLIFFEPLAVFSMAFNTYCSLPCPFMNPAPSPWYNDGIDPRKPRAYPRSPFIDTGFGDDEDYSEGSKPPITPRQPSINSQPSIPTAPAPSLPPPDLRSTPSPAKPEPSSNPDSPTRRSGSQDPVPRPRTISSCSPSQKRFFTSLFSIPGAVVDTLLSGEVVL